MEDDQDDEGCRQDPDVQGVESRQGVVAVKRPADDERLEEFADAGDAAGDVGGHLRGVIALLVPWKEIAGQRQAHDALVEDGVTSHRGNNADRNADQ